MLPVLATKMEDAAEKMAMEGNRALMSQQEVESREVAVLQHFISGEGHMGLQRQQAISNAVGSRPGKELFEMQLQGQEMSQKQEQYILPSLELPRKTFLIL